MTILDEARETSKNVEMETEHTTFEIKQKVSSLRSTHLSAGTVEWIPNSAACKFVKNVLVRKFKEKR